MLFNINQIMQLLEQSGLETPVCKLYETGYIRYFSITPNNRGDILKIQADFCDYYSNTARIEYDTKKHSFKLSCNCYYHYYDKLCVHELALLMVVVGLDKHTKLPFSHRSFKYDPSKNPIYIEFQKKEQLSHLNELNKNAISIINDAKKRIKLETTNLNNNDPILLQLNRSIGSSDLIYSLKIGQDSMYKVKNINNLIELFKHEEVLTYGVKLSLKHSVSLLETHSLSIYQFLINHKGALNYHTYGDFEVTDSAVDDFYDTFKQIPFAMSTTKFLKDELTLTLVTTKVVLYNEIYYNINMIPLDYMLYGNKHIYTFDELSLTRYAFDEQGKVMNLIKALEYGKNTITLKEQDIASFYKYVLSDIEHYLEFEGDSNIFESSEVFDIRLYADIDDHDDLVFQITYMEDEIKKHGFSDSLSNSMDVERIENFIMQFTKEIDNENHIAKLSLKDKKFVPFYENGFENLGQWCEVYVSDAIKKIGKIQKASFHVGVSYTNNLLEVNVDSIHFEKEDLYQALLSYRRKKQYHRLKDGSMWKLDYHEFEQLDTLVNVLGVKQDQLKKGKIQLDKYRAFSIDYLENNLEDIQINRTKMFNQFLEKFEHQKPLKIHSNYDSILKDYQVQGVQWLHKLSDYGFGGILADDMGLGKTIQTIAYLDSVHQKGQKHIVVAPASLILNWEDELHKFNSCLNHVCIHGSASTRKELLNEGLEKDLIITSYDYLRRDIHQYENINFEHIILDEAQYIKNHKTKNATVCKQLNGLHRFALTGTPIENTLAELWSIFDFLMPNYLYSYHHFSHHYERPIVKEQSQEQQTALKKLVEPFILRRSKNEVLQLPNKYEHNHHIEFKEEEAKLYFAQLTLINQELQSSMDLNEVDKIQILAQLTKLRQICCEPRIAYEGFDTPSSKLNHCMNLVKEFKQQHKPVIIFSSFTKTLDLIEEELNASNITYLSLTGSTPKLERKKLVDSFQAGAADVFLISLKAGGTGLNLTNAQAIIHFDPWWNVSAQNQATDRAYRIGQEKEVEVYRLIMKDSIEEKIIQLQEQKKYLSDTFIEGSNGSIASLNANEIMELLKV